MRPIVNL